MGLPCRSSLARLLLSLGSVGSRDAAEDDDVGNGVAAEAVGAVDAARYLARCVEAGDDLTVDANNLCFGVDLDSAHGVVHGGHPGEA